MYVYRVSDTEYGAGFGEMGCKDRGTIVEEWPVNSASDAKFLATHGTAYWKAADRVSKLADLIAELIELDPTFLKDHVRERIVRIEVEKPRKWWFRWFNRAGEAT